jgi:uncharacterized protein (DUF302 family)
LCLTQRATSLYRMKTDAQKATVPFEESNTEHTTEHSTARPPFRFWMTGCMAVVMSSFAGTTLARTESRGLTCHTSRYSVAETVQRIEASAQRHGLQMFALVDRGPSGSPPGKDVPEGTNWKVVVLASSEGGTTPVLMDRPGGLHAVPMSLVVRANGQGGSDVLVGSGASDEALAGLPNSVRRDLAELPGLVAEALR